MITAGKRGFLFTDANYPALRRLMKDLKPDLPPGQVTHAFRHSFTTHFMINRGSIITFQLIIGHSRIEKTMTYAHFTPEYLQDAIMLNPLRGGPDTQIVYASVIFSSLCRPLPRCSPCCKGIETP